MARLARVVAPRLRHRIGQGGIDRTRGRPLGRRTRRSTNYAALSGKVATVAYPSGLTLAYSYNAYGYQSQTLTAGRARSIGRPMRGTSSCT